LAIDRAKEIFHADHANEQALSGAAANVCIYA
jgi:glycine/serine hydroxymethyltransferase